MSTVREIEEAIEKLSKDEYQNFRTWFEQFEAEEWDHIITDDISSGKFDSLKNEALSELVNGSAKKL